MLLTDGERLKFVEYCRMTAASNRALLKQMQELPSAVGEALGQKYTREADAMETVADMLERVESVTIQAGPTPRGGETDPMRTAQQERQDGVAALREAAGPCETQERVLLHSTLTGWANAFERGDHEGAAHRASPSIRSTQTDTGLIDAEDSAKDKRIAELDDEVHLLKGKLRDAHNRIAAMVPEDGP